MAEEQDQLGFSFVAQPVARKVWSPRELMTTLRTNLEQSFGDVWLLGEISNYRPADSGHLYPAEGAVAALSSGERDASGGARPRDHV